MLKRDAKKKKKMRLPSSQERKTPVNIITVLEIDVQKLTLKVYLLM